MKKILKLTLIGLILLSLSSCGTTELLPLQRPGQENRTDPEAYCNINSNGDLIIRVQNLGPKEAPPTKILVEFPGHGSNSVMTPIIPGNSIIEVQVTVPAGCFDSDCEFKITIDSDNNVEELREDNNVASGACIG